MDLISSKPTVFLAPVKFLLEQFINSGRPSSKLPNCSDTDDNLIIIIIISFCAKKQKTKNIKKVDKFLGPVSWPVGGPA
jgi:hypothetical protein